MVNAVASAKLVGLRYVSDADPGLRRKKKRKEFEDLDARGRKVSDPDTLARIKRLAIPPAWTDVWISPREDGHLQATGRDARGRKQYRYHQRWRQVRDETKFHRMIGFGTALPLLRSRIERDLGLSGLPREKVLAAVVRLLEVTLIRVGNTEYARQNGSFGLTTMRDQHVEVERGRLRFSFRGKAGIRHAIRVDDRRLAKIVKRCRDLPGQELFQYLGDDGERHGVGSTEVNEYLRDVTGQDFTSKDFRTWAGTVLAARALSAYLDSATQGQARRNVVRAVEEVAARLGNTVSVCRRCYVHPAVIEAYLDGSLAAALRRRARRKLETRLGRLAADEAAVLAFLERRARAERRARKNAPSLAQLLEKSVASLPSR